MGKQETIERDGHRVTVRKIKSGFRATIVKTNRWYVHVDADDKQDAVNNAVKLLGRPRDPEVEREAA